jgi:hypothetical protein
MNDVIYYCLKGDILNLLRFYSTGVVLGVSVKNGQIKNMDKILSWFNLQGYKTNKGMYQFDGRSISFELTSGVGTVIYNGKLNSDKSLTLHIHSLINGYKAEKRYLRYNQSDLSIIIFKKATNVELKNNPEKPAQKLPDNLSPDYPSLSYRLLKYLFICLVLMSWFTCATRKRSGCHCRDGSNSSATGSGACSWHGGVRYWKHTYWWDW